jgi:hypothetical protein
MKHVVTAMLVIVAIIHLLPLPGVLGTHRLESLYGIPITDHNLEILLRHRSVLFGLLGSFILVAAFHPPLQATAFVLGSISVASFLWLAWTVGGYNAQVARVFFADLVALGCLAIGAVAYVMRRTA